MGFFRPPGATLICAIAALASLCLRRFVVARFAAIVEVTLILTGWSLAQYPRVITPDITVFNAAAPETTLRLLTYALVAGATVLFPSLFFLFRVFKGNEELMLTVLRRRIAVY